MKRHLLENKVIYIFIESLFESKFVLFIMSNFSLEYYYFLLIIFFFFLHLKLILISEIKLTGSFYWKTNKLQFRFLFFIILKLYLKVKSGIHILSNNYEVFFFIKIMTVKYLWNNFFFSIQFIFYLYINF